MDRDTHAHANNTQIHKWANKRTRKQVMLCSDCNVTLCVTCYKPFHTILNLKTIKADLENDCEICIDKNSLPSPS